jgi:cystathionine gamma-lyase
MESSTKTATQQQQVMDQIQITAKKREQGFGTKAIHAGQVADPSSGAVIIPISLSTTFQQQSPGVHRGYEYARTGNPTRDALEHNLAALEKAEWGVVFASGLSTTNGIMTLLQMGDHVVAMDDLYGGTRRLFTRVNQLQGLSFSFVDFNDESALESAITPATKLLWLETPTNPLLKIADIRKVAAIAQRKQLLFVVDNTFMSPYFQNPLELGADMVMHSCTKYINGHSDVVMGVVCGRDQELYRRLKFIQNAVGAVPSPFDSFLVLRGTKTLHVRMREHEKSATKIAHWLVAHPKVERVLYPGLTSHPQHEIAKAQMHGYGGMITFFLKGGIVQARQFLENVHLFALAESLGGVESLVDHPVIMTHASVPVEERAKLGISDNLVRLSVGLEDVEDLLGDLAHALNQVNA